MNLMLDRQTANINRHPRLHGVPQVPRQYPETGGLPSHWIPFKHFWFAAAMVVIVPRRGWFIFGWLAFRSRIKGVYFSILNRALTAAACLMFFRNDFTFGGNNASTDFKTIVVTT